MKLNLLLLLLFFISCTQGSKEIQWPESTQTSKPWTRWWWPGNAVDKENLKKELQQFAESGIGGVEITPIYGVKGEEHRFIEYLSPEFSEILEYTIEEANNLGLGVDLPPGSGWRCGGPFVPREKGLWNLKIEKSILEKGEKLDWPENEAEIASASFVSENEKSIVIQPNSNFTAPYYGTVYFAFRVKSGNKVKRAADGGKGWAIDTFNKEITNWYLNEFWKKLGIDKGKLRCFFHDSFEYTGDFTTDFLTEFKTRRGYDLTEYLHVLAGDGNKEMTARVKSDYRETLADLVYDSFIVPMTDWANKHESLNRNQAHGSPGNILDLYAACDIPETEIFRYVEPGTVDVFVNKFASSAAHVTGQKLVSSESYTWLKEHWTVTTSDLVRATNRFFLAGINHMFFHGTCYSPEDAQWPGWLFYASTQINDRNPLWRELPALFKYIERTQTVLQNATPQNDLLVYWPYYDVAASPGRIFNHLGVNKDAGWFRSHPISELSQKLTDAGYTFDYISDKQLANCAFNEDGIVTSGNSTYKAIVVPKTQYIPLETIEKLKQFSGEGATVIFDEQLPESIPGMFELDKRSTQLNEIKATISADSRGEALAKLTEFGITGEPDLSRKGFHFLKLNAENDDLYLIFNTNLEMKDQWVELNTKAKDFVFMNPMNGKISKPATKGNKLRIQLNTEEIVFVRCSKKPVNADKHVYLEKDAAKQQIDGRWKVEFIEGGPVFPGNTDMNELQSWTKVGDIQTERFAGTARYSIDFNWDGPTSGFLDLGEVKVCAHVFVNNKDFGTSLGPEFRKFVDNLQVGTNKLVVEVSNVAANRIRDLDKRNVNWKKFHDINFVSIEYEPFDASGWEIKKAGLMGPVEIIENH